MNIGEKRGTSLQFTHMEMIGQVGEDEHKTFYLILLPRQSANLKKNPSC
jgi:hypothetical protein